MALHSNLPIYKVAYDLLNLVTDLAKNMPRDFKASIGAKLRDECVDVTVLIFRANCSRGKTPHIDALIERVQVMELLLRLSCDKKLISEGQYARAIRKSENIGKQATGWRNAMNSPDSRRPRSP
ncbi:MAG: four helix bundle protein [Bradyrhizobium sp.]|uniref:four helix bundle protein n=1 Tax=Bradyrhizobium sp. TaxID=376 RepID=UPI003D12265D